MLLTNTQVSKPHKAFANNSSANIKLTKIKMKKKIGQSGEFFLKLLPKTRLHLMKNELKTFAKFVLIALEIISAGTATDAAIF